MKSFHELPLTEQGRIQRAIAAAWTDSEAVATSAETQTTVASILGKYPHPDPKELSAAEAETAATKLVKAARLQGVVLHGPKWLGGKEYYRWLHDEFLQQTVSTTVSREQPVDFHFTELVPDGVDNMFVTITGFLDELFELNDLPHVKWLHKGALGERFKSRHYYLSAWSNSFLNLKDVTVRPLAVRDLAPQHVRLDFKISYGVTFEDHSQRSYDGQGEIEMRLHQGLWRITELRFPGFCLPE